MPSIVRQRDIIDRRALAEQLSAAVPAVRSSAIDRGAYVAPLKAALTSGHAEIRRRFEATGDGAAVMREQCFLIDQLIRVLFDLVTGDIYPLPNPTSGEKLAIVAVGGYGRGEMAPYSDIDLLFLLPYKRTPHTEQVVEYLLYLLWDLGLKIGQATRSVEECLRQAKSDLTIRTGLLEARYLWGEQALFRDLKKRFRFRRSCAALRRNSLEVNLPSATRGTSASATAVISSSQTSKRARAGSETCTRCSGSPNTSTAPTTSASLSSWVYCRQRNRRVSTTPRVFCGRFAAISTTSPAAPKSASLSTCRPKSHGGWATPMVQEDAGVERFMKDYFLVAKDIGDLTRIFCAILEADQKRRRRLSWVRWGAGRRSLGGFLLDGEWLTIPAEDFFKRDPVALLRLFHVAQEHELDIHPRALRAASQSLQPDRRPTARGSRGEPPVHRDPDLAQGSGDALRRMNEAGVFGCFIPDFRPCRRADAVRHVPPSIRSTSTRSLRSAYCIRSRAGSSRRSIRWRASSLQASSRGVRSTWQCCCTISPRAAAAITRRSANRSPLKLGPRLGLSDEETETVAWLVRWHLLMSGTAFKLDISDPKTIADFVERVQSPERLKLLLVLTVADIRAVGPNIWNGWKAALLRELYQRAIEVMSGGLTVAARDSRIAAAQAAARRLLPDFSEEEFADFTNRGYPFYWLSFDAGDPRPTRPADA